MDRDLIERLSREAELWPALAIPNDDSPAATADANSLNENLIAQRRRFAVLVAQECAKLVEADRGDPTWLGETTRLAAGKRIRDAFCP